ncbi:MAG TPA: hypothetical protein VIY90_22925 [Steroidobacteraceae bacterium]
MTTTLVILPTATGWTASETPASSAPTSPASRIPEVTVTARRLELEQSVAKFVNQIAATENGGEGLARWEVPAVCPLVSGLSRQDGEFILGRLSQIAHEAGVPLADEHCRPNLYILVTTQPEDLLKGMEKRNRSFTFGYDRSFYPPTETPASVVDEFIKTPRAVRVWYSSAEEDAWGQPLAYCQSNLVLPQCPQAGPAACDPNRYYRCGPAIAGGSHLVFNAVWSLSRVFVIVDRTRLKGVTLGQLADYVALSGFAKLKPDARLGDSPTILTLFNGAPKAAPAGMAEWDRIFLKSLYATEQKSRLQRSQIAHRMVHEIAP